MCTLEGAIKTFQAFKVPSNFIFEQRAFRKVQEIDLRKFYLFVDFYVQPNKYETAPNFIQLTQNLTLDCWVI